MVFEPPEPVLAKLTTRTLAGNHRSRIVRKHAGHRRQIADVPVDDAQERDDRGLVGCDAATLKDDSLVSLIGARDPDVFDGKTWPMLSAAWPEWDYAFSHRKGPSSPDERRALASREAELARRRRSTGTREPANPELTSAFLESGRRYPVDRRSVATVQNQD
jgi:hypothetical protein